MIKFLISVFTKDSKNFSSLSVRKCCGIICASTGIVLNFILFFVKLLAGKISGSVAVTVDAVHNLTDMGSSVVTLISFLLPEKEKRLKENIAGLVIGVVLVIAGVELAAVSSDKINSPEPVEFSVFSLLLLGLSVTVKFFMAGFNRKYGIKIGSAALMAASTDCICDSLATAVAAAAVLAANFTDINIDAYGGLTVSIFILAAGAKTVFVSVRELVFVVKDKIAS